MTDTTGFIADAEGEAGFPHQLGSASGKGGDL